MNMNTQPDNWVVLKIKYNTNETLYKVLGGWWGGYLHGDSWRLNSGIVRAEEDGDYILFHGSSGSVYQCHKESYRLSMATAGIYDEIINTKDADVEMMPEDTDWVELDY
jgi:hypothetical protein